MQLTRTSKYNNLLFTLLGLLVFSPLSSKISSDYLHLPLALPELLFIPFLFLLKNKFKSIRFKGRTIVKTIFATLLLLAFALLSASFSIFAILSNARAWIYTLLFLGVFREKNDITYEDLLYLAFGSIIGWSIVCVMNMNSSTSLEEYIYFVTYGLMMSIPMFYSISIANNKKILLLLGSVLIIAIIILCGARRVMLVTLIVISASIFIHVLRNKSKLLLYSIIGFAVAVAISSAMPLVEEYVKEISPYLHYRLFVRTEALANEGVEASNDTHRLEILSSTYEEMEKTCLPQGFISMQTGSDEGVGRYTDYPLTMLFWIFSWPVALGIVLYFIVIFIKNVSIYLKTGETANYVSAINLLTMILLLFLEGTFLVFAYATPITGALLGLSIRSATKNTYS